VGSFPFFKFSDDKKEYGYDKEEAFQEELKKSEDLLKLCGDKLFFEIKDWKKNNIIWKERLQKLYAASKGLAGIRIKKLKREINTR